MKKISEIQTDKVVLLNISRCYNADEKEEDIYKRTNVYEMVRKYWKVDKSHVEQADYVFGVANGLVVAVYTDMRWKYEEYNGYLRCSFEGVEVKDSKYLGLKVSDYVRSQNPVTYINC